VYKEIAVSEEKIEITTEDVIKNIEDETEITEEQIQEEPTQQKPVKRGKLALAKEKIEQAKVLTAVTKEQIEECMKNIDADIDVLNSEKQVLFDTALQPSEKFLERLGIDETVLAEVPQSRVELIDMDEDEVAIRDLSSGRFKGFFFALLAGIATFMGWAFTASNALGLSIPPEKIPDLPRLSKMLSWTSEQLGQGSNANIGATVVVVTVLLVMWIVYAIIVSSRARHNLTVAQQTEEAVGAYCTTKEECKEKMKLVREHIQNSTNTVKKYTVLLEEQNAKIRRAIFLEEVESLEGLHANTKADIATTQHLIVEVKKLLEAPISEVGVLTADAIDTLKRANKTINDHIMKLYS
jgi:hypothetical protein